ncbi:RidA family protein [Alloacidobacterium sp.]|uniref:RidA family protein n=1 Tax=Alloacidobacterium sp. TaxID=2951999 RepID=UPI002D5585B4|nr:RidA family protein [Alloacidobacterium sp.]HYK35322.1 RidA family protein [Alloacidobacterium sp.]
MINARQLPALTFCALLFGALFIHVLAQAAPLSDGAPASPSVLANGTLYVSGQGSRRSDGSRPQEFPEQVAQALHNVQAILQGAGMDFDNVVWMNIYLTSTTDIAAMDDVYWKEIGSNPPARTVLTVAALPDGDRIEINCIAVQDKAHRHAVWPQGWPKEPHSDPPAIQAGDVLYLSAQGGADPRSGRLASDFSGEVKQALDNVNTVLQAAHMTTKNVVWVNPYMSVGGKYDAMGKIYATYFEFGNTPGRGTIQVMGLPKGNHIVFSCIAGADLSKRKAVRPRNMPPSPTASPGVLYGDTLYLSAKDGFIPGQGIVTPDLDLQLRQSMRNLLDGLEEADMDFSDVVFSTVYLRQMQDEDRMNALYGKFFKGKYPVQTVLQQNRETDDEAAEQISFIAVRKQK